MSETIERTGWESSERGECEAPEQLARECGVSILAAAYETFRGRPIMPGTVMLDFCDDLNVYNVSRHIKRPDDSIEYFLSRKNLPLHTKQFLEVAFSLVEDAYNKGVDVQKLMDNLDDIAQRSAKVILVVPPETNKSDASKFVWDGVIEQEYQRLSGE